MVDGPEVSVPRIWPRGTERVKTGERSDLRTTAREVVGPPDGMPGKIPRATDVSLFSSSKVVTCGLSLAKTRSALKTLGFRRVSREPPRMIHWLIFVVRIAVTSLKSRRVLLLENLALRHRLLLLTRNSKVLGPAV